MRLDQNSLGDNLSGKPDAVKTIRSVKIWDWVYECFRMSDKKEISVEMKRTETYCATYWGQKTCDYEGDNLDVHQRVCGLAYREEQNIT